MSASPLLPAGTREFREGSRIEWDFAVPNEYPYVEGHFPGNPIVPGVAQIGWCLKAAARLGASGPLHVSRFRFLAPIRPGQSIRVLASLAAGKYVCEVHADGALASKGSVWAKEVSEGPHRPLVVIPSYNTGISLLRRTVENALAGTEAPIWVVIDGSTDGSEAGLEGLVRGSPRLRVLRKRENQGKGAAVRATLQEAEGEGYTHALVMDADGQHPAERIDDFLRASRERPEAMVLGQPIFDESVPLERLYGRKLSVWLVRLETWSAAIGDPLFGFRVYPIQPLLAVMGKGGRSDRYDFDPEVAVRLHWSGVPAVKAPAKVEYLSKEQGGVSHFHYLRDNARFIWLHARLLVEAPFRCLRSGRRG